MPRYLKRRTDSPYWWYDFTVKGRRYRGSTETDAVEAAQIIAAKLRSDTLIGLVTGKKETTTLDAALGRYLLEHAGKLAGLRNVNRTVGLLSAGIGAGTPLAELTDAQVARYVSKRRGQVSDSTVNREIEVLRAALNMAARRWGMAVAAIDWKAHRLIEPAGRDRYLTPAEADRLLSCAPEHLHGPLLFALYTGARRGNVKALDWSQIDMRARIVRFRQKSRTPGGASHAVPLCEPLFLFLANLGPKESGPVWRYANRPLRKWDKAFANACRRAGIEGLRWHDLRHTAASWMLAQGVPLRAVGDILGHKSIQTTARYAHLDQTARTAAVASIAAHWRHGANSTPAKRLKQKG